MALSRESIMIYCGFREALVAETSVTENDSLRMHTSSRTCCATSSLMPLRASISTGPSFFQYWGMTNESGEKMKKLNNASETFSLKVTKT